VVECVRGFLQQAFEQGASDIHLEARRDELAVRFRVHGALHEYTRLPGAWARPTIACLKALAHIGSKAEASKPDDEADPPETSGVREGSIPFVFRRVNYEVRIATLPTLHGENAVLHVKRSQRAHRELDQLGLADEQLVQLQPIFDARDGLVLVTGPAGSGRTTTMSAMLARFATPVRKVVALAEPVENELEGVTYVRADARTGFDNPARVRAMLAQDPDIVAVPEFDAPGMARSLFDAALSGRMVLAAQRARGALETLTRLLHFGLEPYLLADVLRGVIGQRLVRRLCADCKRPASPEELASARLELAHDHGTFFESQGCDDCHGTGFSGRLPVFEVLSITPGLRREIEKGAQPDVLARAARTEGFTDLREHVLRQARAGLTTLHEVLVATAGT